MRKVSGWQRDMWRFLYRNRLEERHWHVLEQDRVILEIMEPEARNNEKLYQHDIGVVQVRRLFEAAARAQVNGLAQAAE
jgi:ribosomal silencing factor RsfS